MGSRTPEDEQREPCPEHKRPATKAGCRQEQHNTNDQTEAPLEVKKVHEEDQTDRPRPNANPKTEGHTTMPHASSADAVTSPDRERPDSPPEGPQGRDNLQANPKQTWAATGHRTWRQVTACSRRWLEANQKPGQPGQQERRKMQNQAWRCTSSPRTAHGLPLQ